MVTGRFERAEAALLSRRQPTGWNAPPQQMDASDKRDHPPPLQIVVQKQEQPPPPQSEASDKSKQPLPQNAPGAGPSVKVQSTLNYSSRPDGWEAWDLELGGPRPRIENDRGWRWRCSRMGEAIAALGRYLVLGSSRPPTRPRYYLFSDEGDLEAGGVGAQSGLQTINTRNHSTMLREMGKEWCKQVTDAISVSQGLSRFVYAGYHLLVDIIISESADVFSDDHPVPTRAVVGMVIEMLSGFLAITIAHYAIISSHTVQTTALHISREAERTAALMMLAFTGGWMLTYTLHISPVVYREWMWAITSIFLLINLRNTIIFGCRGQVTEDEAIHCDNDNVQQEGPRVSAYRLHRQHWS